MDLSSLPEEQRQQLQKIQQLFQEHQQQQQQQQQEQQQQQQQHDASSSQPYDPTQVQPYDQQSYYAYYQQYQHDPNQSQPYPQQQQGQSQQQQNQHYDYYQPNYSNAYQQPQQQAYPESTPLPAPTEPNSGGGTAVADGTGKGQDAYYPPQQQQQAAGAGENLGFAMSVGLNPAAAAAVAALSQLTQFAGTMEAAEKAMALVRGGGGFGPGMSQASGPGYFMGTGPVHHGQGPFHMQPAGQSVYRGGGRRSRASRGGNFGNRPPRSSGMDPALRARGRGRGRGGPMRFPRNNASSSSRSKPSGVGEAELNEGGAVTEPTADNHEETEEQKPENGAPIKRAWCELCRVDCTSLEILEQHKNGKKHKKNLQKMEELPNAIKPVTEVQNEQKSVAESNPEIVQEGEDNKKLTLPENLTTEALATDKKEGMERQINIAEQRRGVKRMMRGGRGGKRLRTDGPRRPMEPPKQPKVVIPLICDLCNVKCDTQEVFDRHLAGKKHISKLKRFEGHQAMYGPEGLQALYPPNPLSQTLLHHQGPQQAFYGPQVSYPPPGPYVPPTQGHHLAHNPSHQGPGSSSYYDGHMAAPVVQQQPAAFGTESNQNGASGSEAIGLAQQVIP